MWNTVGARRDRAARKPPMPSTISWRMRISWSPPYRRSVIDRRQGSPRRPCREGERHAADLRAPDEGADRDELAHGRRRARRSGASARARAAAGSVGPRVALDLPVVGVERLAEIAAPVEEADADERDAEVARRLQVVAGEDAEAAGVDRQSSVQAELGGEVRDEEVVRTFQSPSTTFRAAITDEPILHARRAARGSRRQARFEVGVGQLGEKRVRVF